ncbi:hypothetical protein EJB05_11946, partial [Eragrostis curvula]
MASRVRRNLESRPQQLALTDDLLEEIFLRIACPADLARASAACVGFRRLITDRIFLRRYRSRHPPLLLGFLNIDVDKGFHAVEAPHPNAPAARAMANVSFDFLPPPSPKDWYISDVRDGLVLFRSSESIGGAVVVTGLVICDPSSLSRRYLLLPPVPVDQEGQGLQDFDAAFAPCEQEEDDGKLFRVISTMYYNEKIVVLVFDSASGSWTIGTSASWDPLSLSNELIPCPWAFLMGQCYAYGCFYWKIDEQNKLLKLDINRMEFSTVDLPPGHEEHDVVVVEAGEGMIGMFSNDPDAKFLNCYNGIRNKDQRGYEWQMRDVVPFPVDNVWISDAKQGCVFLQGDSKVQDSEGTTVYSLDIKTLKFDMLAEMSCHFRGHPYFGFPPSIYETRRFSSYTRLIQYVSSYNLHLCSKFSKISDSSVC